jgi:hypothetical protein
MPRGVLKVLALGAALALFLVGLIALGKVAWEQLRREDRRTVAITDIECTPPPGQGRVDFLDEVQYLAGLPERLPFLDRDLAERLGRAFARHPWVAKVERVELIPPRRIQVRLVYRTPVLAVVWGSPKDGSAVTMVEARSGNMGQRNALVVARAVDGQGILLPARWQRGVDLPLFSGPVKPPAGPAGTPWGDGRVEGAARTAAYLQSYQDRLHLTDVESGPDGLVWSTHAGTRVRWGLPVGTDSDREAPALKKRERLLHYCDEYGNLDRPAGRPEHDVRPP